MEVQVNWFNPENETAQEQEFRLQLEASLQSVADVLTESGGEPEAIAQVIEAALPKVIYGLTATAPPDTKDRLRLVVSN